MSSPWGVAAQALRHHYPEYLMEAAGLGVFMVSACVVTALFEYPSSWIHQAIASPLLRRLMIATVMGLTAMALVYSPWGKQSGAHLNPAVTLTFWWLGKVKPVDACFYGLAQFVGGWLGILGAAKILGVVILNPAVDYVVTVPGIGGVGVAFWAELGISFGLMLTILVAANIARLAPLTGILAGILIAIYITLEAPLSGTSMNPARTLASAIPAHTWTGIWVYFTAPVAGMLGAAEVYVFLRGRRAVKCAKLNHDNHKRCIFCGSCPPPGNNPQMFSRTVP